MDLILKLFTAERVSFAYLFFFSWISSIPTFSTENIASLRNYFSELDYFILWLSIVDRKVDLWGIFYFLEEFWLFDMCKNWNGYPN